MRRTILSLLLAAGLVGAPRPSFAAEPSPKVTEMQQLHGQAQAHVQQYNVTFDAKQLEAAHELLARWLVEHRAHYGDTPAAVSVRAPVEQQLSTIDAELQRVGAAASAGPAVPVAVAPARPVMSPEQAAELRASRGWIAGGVTSIALGGVVLVGVSLPLWLLRERALRRANEQTFYADEQRLVSRARRRQAGAFATFAVGAAFAGAGVAMLTVGVVKRMRVRSELSWAPALGPGFAGASATLRF